MIRNQSISTTTILDESESHHNEYCNSTSIECSLHNCYNTTNNDGTVWLNDTNEHNDIDSDPLTRCHHHHHDHSNRQQSSHQQILRQRNLIVGHRKRRATSEESYENDCINEQHSIGYTNNNNNDGDGDADLEENEEELEEDEHDDNDEMIADGCGGGGGGENIHDNNNDDLMKRQHDVSLLMSAFYNDKCNAQQNINTTTTTTTTTNITPATNTTDECVQSELTRLRSLQRNAADMIPFNSLSAASLRRYKKFFKLSHRSGASTKQQLLDGVPEHFVTLAISALPTAACLLYTLRMNNINNTSNTSNTNATNSFINSNVKSDLSTIMAINDIL